MKSRIKSHGLGAELELVSMSQDSMAEEMQYGAEAAQ